MKQVLLITKGILSDRQLRRRTMFQLVIAALAMLMGGITLLEQPLRERPVLFMLYWFLCAWLNLTIILLAFFDMLAVRREHLQEKEQLRRQLLRGTSMQDEERAP